MLQAAASPAVAATSAAVAPCCKEAGGGATTGRRRSYKITQRWCMRATALLRAREVLPDCAAVLRAREVVLPDWIAVLPADLDIFGVLQDRAGWEVFLDGFFVFSLPRER